MKKRALVRNVLLSVLVALLLAGSFIFAQDPKPFLGKWKGSISIMGTELEIIVEFSLDDKGNIQGTIDVPQQGAEDLPLGEIKIEGKKISFMIVAPGVQGDPTFQGELDESGKKIAGTFSQMGYEGTFTLEK